MRCDLALGHVPLAAVSFDAVDCKRWIPLLAVSAVLAGPAAAQAALDPLPLFLQHDIAPAHLGRIALPATGAKGTTFHTCTAHPRSGKRTFDKVQRKVVSASCEEPPLANVNVAGTILLGR